jgi:hypothetical protein
MGWEVLGRVELGVSQSRPEMLGVWFVCYG